MAIFCVCVTYTTKLLHFWEINSRIIFLSILKHHRLRSICLQQKQVALVDHQEAVILVSLLHLVSKLT